MGQQAHQELLSLQIFGLNFYSERSTTNGRRLLIKDITRTHVIRTDEKSVDRGRGPPTQNAVVQIGGLLDYCLRRGMLETRRPHMENIQWGG